MAQRLLARDNACESGRKHSSTDNACEPAAQARRILPEMISMS
jgi:hypothetical protein